LAGNQYEVTSENYKKIIKKFNPISIERLKTHGFVFEYKSDMVIIRNDVYPDMLIAAEAVIAAGYAHYKVNRDYFMRYCDFRAFVKYKRTYEDLHFVFSDDTRKIAEQLHEYNASHKIMPQKCNYFFRVEYKLKGKIVYISNLAQKNNLRIYIGFAELNGEAYKMIEKEIHRYEDYDKFAEFCRKNLMKCTNCTPNCGKKGKTTKKFGKNTFV